VGDLDHVGPHSHLPRGELIKLMCTIDGVVSSATSALTHGLRKTRDAQASNHIDAARRVAYASDSDRNRARRFAMLPPASRFGLKIVRSRPVVRPLASAVRTIVVSSSQVNPPAFL
jgi:hypothetical protein